MSGVSLVPTTRYSRYLPSGVQTAQQAGGLAFKARIPLPSGPNSTRDRVSSDDPVEKTIRRPSGETLGGKSNTRQRSKLARIRAVCISNNCSLPILDNQAAVRKISSLPHLSRLQSLPGGAALRPEVEPTRTGQSTGHVPRICLRRRALKNHPAPAQGARDCGVRCRSELWGLQLSRPVRSSNSPVNPR